MSDAENKSFRRKFPKVFRKNSRPGTSFSHSQILPEPDHKLDAHVVPFGAPPDLPQDRRDGSVSPESVFQGAGEGSPQQSQRQQEYASPKNLPLRAVNQDHHRQDYQNGDQNNDEPGSYDLKPPAPSVTHDNVEALSERFLSVDHLNLILRDQTLCSRFTNFIRQYKPSLTPALTDYLETQKAITAVEYANTIAENITPAPGHPPFQAAVLDERFDERAQDIVEDLVNEALPAYTTHRLVQLVTDSLVKEITGNNSPIMREMIPSLAEVYCVTDPSVPDNPIVYASEEFYNTSQYGKDYTIGRNCRFLQGPKTANASVRRLVEALAAGQEVTETILNYRRDGSPFMNLLMIAPLYDNKGTVRYFIGCQIDVSSLIEGGHGLESFQQLLSNDRADSRFGGRSERKPADVLGQLGAMFDEEESNVMKSQVQRYGSDAGGAKTPNRRTGRRILGMDDSAAERAMWPHPSLGPSGRLPGVYQNYLLVRPYPSLRITFTSPALRIPGLLQAKFLDRVGGPSHVREGILDSLAHGTSVTAKIAWLPNGSGTQDGRSQDGRSQDGKTRWIHCTPLMGSDEKVGVWMIVMVESEEVTGQLNRNNHAVSEAGGGGSMSNQNGIGSSRYTGNKLYTEYLRREGVNGNGTSQSSRQSSKREERDAHFRDF